MEALKIGLTYTGTDEKHNNYVNWLQQGGNVEVVTLKAGTINTEEIQKLDGIVLSGGIDIHPQVYNSAHVNYPNRPDAFHPERDEFEKTIFEISQDRSIPLLGICRGLQLVNCLTGGTLIQDLGNNLNQLHRFDKSDKKHVVQIDPSSLLSDIIRLEAIEVNSAHHQAIDRLGTGLKVNARSADGIVEGIEWENSMGKSFFVAVQWHPERMQHVGLQNTPGSINIRERFLHEIKQFRKP